MLYMSNSVDVRRVPLDPGALLCCWEESNPVASSYPDYEGPPLMNLAYRLALGPRTYMIGAVDVSSIPSNDTGFPPERAKS
jgi:hypothetical protein